MAQSLGTASLVLTADSRHLDSKLGKSEQQIQGWGSRVSRGLKGGLKLAGGGALAAVGAVTAGLAAVNPFERVEGELSEALHTAVSIKAGARGTGQIIITYSSGEDLERLLAQLKGEGAEVEL